MATVFSRIIAGELPGVFVWRDQHCVAFLSINPIAEGHVLVVPVDEIDHWLDCPPELTEHLFRVARAIGEAQQRAFPCERIALIIAGFEVPHTHVHVIPASSMGDVSFANARTTIGRDELDRAADRLRDALRAMGRAEVAS